MEFTNSFTVNASVDAVWDILVDAQQVAPCVPGAQITEVVDEAHYRGTVKVKLGPVQMTYRGELEMETDAGGRTITLHAKGSEVRGSGGASGTFVSHLTPTEIGGTKVDIDSRVDVTGRAAQFGRGIMQDVANRLIKQFADCLEEKVGSAAQEVAPAAAGSVAPAASPPAPSASPNTAPTPHGEVPSSPRPRPEELRISELLADAARARLAKWLRELADRLEPKS
jgi:carbon monoxide dehydrogenase subunit G